MSKKKQLSSKKSEKKIKGSSFRFFEKKFEIKFVETKKVHAAAWTSVFFLKSIPLFFEILNLKKTVLLHRQKFKFLKINKNTNYVKKELKKILKKLI